MGPPQQIGFILASITTRGEDLVFTFEIAQFFLKLHIIALNPLWLLFSHFHLETIVYFLRSFQWAFDVPESKDFDWLFELDCACWA